ncbi:MAG TPA: hypothetical protein VFW33_08905, partial [Gemmataceae bacterium]|nr:hypothetical protein [Gemmataceae bacterium]
MLRWLSVFGAVGLVAIGVVFYIYGGPPAKFFVFQPPQPTVEKKQDAPAPAAPEKVLEAQERQRTEPAPAGPWSRVVAVTPRVVIPGARLTARYTLRVSALRDGQIAVLGTEIPVRAGEQPPAGAVKQTVAYLVTEAAGEEKRDDWVVLNGKWYRPLTKQDEVRPNKVKLVRAEKWFLPLEDGVPVREGQLLGMIDPSTAVDDLAIKVSKFDAAEADRAAEEKQRDEYKERWQRADKLYKQGSGSYEDMTAAKLAYEYHFFETIHKQEDLKVAGNEMRQVETLLDQHMIKSKISGQIKQVIRRPGESVKGLDVAVLEMIDYSKLRIKGRVALQDLASLPDPRNPQDKRVIDIEATGHVPPSQLLTGHVDAVTGVAVSKDGQVVSVSEDHTLRVWEKDLGKRKERLVLRQPAAVRAVACSPKELNDANLCLTGAADGIARLYDLTPEAGGRLVRELTNGHKEGINCVAFSADGRWAVTGGDDRAICLWDVASGQLLQKNTFADGHKAGVTSVTFLSVGPEKKLSVVSAGRDNALIVWPLAADGTPDKPMRFDRRFGEVPTLGVNPDGRQLLFDQ